jgi:azurin
MNKGIIALTVLALSLTACGGGNSSENASKDEKKIELAPETETTSAPADVPEVAEVVIEGNDQMQFNTKRIEVYAGQKVKLTLKHTGELPLESMGHNWVLLAKGVNKGEYAEAAIGFKDEGYIVPDRTADVIAYTKQVGGGEETTIEFDAPEKGSYDFMCTFPGHFGMMNGKFVVL